MEKRKILIIEDNPDITQALVQVLSDCGHDVETAVNGKDGLDHLINHPRPDLILLDLHLPVISGVDFLKRLAGIPALAFIPVIAMSADIAAHRLCEQNGIPHFLRKPFELEELFGLLEDVLRAPPDPEGDRELKLERFLKRSFLSNSFKEDVMKGSHRKGFNKKLGDAIERVGEKVSNAGATRIGGKIYNAGNKLEHKDDPVTGQDRRSEK